MVVRIDVWRIKVQGGRSIDELPKVVETGVRLVLALLATAGFDDGLRQLKSGSGLVSVR
jgi:hypothetical protein